MPMDAEAERKGESHHHLRENVVQEVMLYADLQQHKSTKLDKEKVETETEKEKGVGTGEERGSGKSSSPQQLFDQAYYLDRLTEV